MGTGFKHGAGGGNPLNFKVVGNPQPSNPKENTIWINTDDKITSYIFSATQPTGSAGMVWISTGTTSTVAFNALKKNGIQVYPISAKQYVSGAWVDVTAKSRQGGEWVDWWNGELYKIGNEYASLTGGWGSTDIGYLWAGSTVWMNPAKKNANSITVQSISDKGSAVGTKNKIDVTDYTKLEVKLTANGGNENSVVAISSERECNASNASFAGKVKYASGTNIIVTLDISKISGSYYVLVAADGRYTTTVHEVWLKK